MIAGLAKNTASIGRNGAFGGVSHNAVVKSQLTASHHPLVESSISNKPAG
jgi:hypothetical protein